MSNIPNLVVLVFASCVSSIPIFSGDCDIPALPPGQSWLSEKIYGGVYIYSWKNNHKWQYHLRPGANFRTTEQNVLDCSTQFKSLEDLKATLGKLAPGESVQWYQLGIRFRFPPEDQVNDIREFCKSKNLALQIMQTPP